MNNGHVTNGSNRIPLAFHGGGSDDADSVDVGGGGDVRLWRGNYFVSSFVAFFIEKKRAKFVVVE